LDEADNATPPVAPAKPTHSAAPPQPWPVQAPAARRVQEKKAEQAPEPLLEPVLNALQPEAAPEITAKPAAHKYGPGTLDEFVADLEASLGNDFLAEPSQPATATPVQAAAATPPHMSKASTPVPAARAAAAAASASSSAPALKPPPVTPLPMADAGLNVDLTSMFGELKQELEHGSEAADEDPETHYNLGVAFREMGLLDEAIGELQKVCHYLDRGKPFPHVMQTYTWLAQCFLEKGIPEVAARWYEKALKLPNLDQETRTALHYELASALESAGQKPAALNNFLEVYSSNIDYRDVAERIKALRT
jgi:tetratricopeptide (TPR) repeat protein